MAGSEPQINHLRAGRVLAKDMMYAAVIRAAERWRGIAIGEFEQRQLRAVREELGRAHAERVAPAVVAKATAAVRKIRVDR